MNCRTPSTAKAGSSSAEPRSIPPVFGFARLTADGALDSSFGAGGKTHVTSVGGILTTGGLKIDSDGSIRGILGQNLATIKLTAAGMPDASFGNGGVTIAASA